MNQSFKINFQPLYHVAQFLALTMIILIPLQIVVYMIAPPPDTVKGFFELYQQNPFLGLLSLDFLLFVVLLMINFRKFAADTSI